MSFCFTLVFFVSCCFFSVHVIQFSPTACCSDMYNSESSVSFECTVRNSLQACLSEVYELHATPADKGSLEIKAQEHLQVHAPTHKSIFSMLAGFCCWLPICQAETLRCQTCRNLPLVFFKTTALPYVNSSVDTQTQTGDSTYIHVQLLDAMSHAGKISLLSSVVQQAVKQRPLVCQTCNNLTTLVCTNNL